MKRAAVANGVPGRGLLCLPASRRGANTDVKKLEVTPDSFARIRLRYPIRYRDGDQFNRLFPLSRWDTGFQDAPFQEIIVDAGTNPIRPILLGGVKFLLDAGVKG